MQMVEGHLAWQEQKTDYILDNLAWFSANQMMSGGNMKKGTDALKIKKGLFVTTDDYRKENTKTQTDKKVSVKDEQERLKKIFGLNKEN